MFEPAAGFWVLLASLASILASFVLWVIALVEAAGIPDQQFRAVGTSKALWIVLIVITGVAGPFIWLFGKRRDVRAAGMPRALPAAGWYLDPDPGTAALRWWEGTRWTDARHDLPLPPEAPVRRDGR